MIWLAAAIGAISLGVASGGKTNDNFTIPGTEAQNAANVLSSKLPPISGGQSTIVFATTHGNAKGIAVWVKPPGDNRHRHSHCRYGPAFRIEVCAR
jgi:hypothetical protein